MNNLLSSMSSHLFPRCSTFKKNVKIKKIFCFSKNIEQNINILDMNKLFPARPGPSHPSGLNFLGLGRLCIPLNLQDTDQVILEYRPKQA